MSQIYGLENNVIPGKAKLYCLWFLVPPTPSRGVVPAAPLFGGFSGDIMSIEKAANTRLYKEWAKYEEKSLA